MNPTGRRRPNALALAAVAACLLISITAANWSRLPRHWSFSPLKWRIAKSESRSGMARDYLASRTVKGMTRAQVLADLGEPSNSADYLAYVVSSKGLADPMAPTLYLYFDAEGRRVTKCVIMYIPQPQAQIEFDPVAWRSYAFFRDQRAPLANALWRSQQLRGASRTDVLRDLGPPDRTQTEMHYEVGASPELWLIIRFDENERVIDATLRAIENT